MKDTLNGKSYREAVEIAYVRFAVIAPVIQGLFSEDTKTEYYRNVASKPLTMPDGREMVYRPNTFEKWEQQYRRYGMEGLMPKTRADSGVPRALSDTSIQEIYRLKQECPRINATLIYEKLVEDGFINRLDVSLCTVQRFIKRNDLKSAQEPNAKDRKAFEEEYPCMMYQADTCHSIYITENGHKRKTYLFHIVDDNTRLIAGARFFYEETAYNFQIVLKEAIARYGICKKLYLDHGSPYINTQLKMILGSLGVIGIHTKVRDAAAKGKVERSFRTLKDTWLNGFDPASVSSLAELNSCLADYVRMRNTSVNRDIGETPMERYTRHIDHIRTPESREWLDQCFMHRVVRKVMNDATVSIDSVSYDVPLQFIRMKVEIRFLPDNMKSAYVLHDNKQYPIRPTNRVENARTKRQDGLSIDYSPGGKCNV